MYQDNRIRKSKGTKLSERAQSLVKNHKYWKDADKHLWILQGALRAHTFITLKEVCRKAGLEGQGKCNVPWFH